MAEGQEAVNFHQSNCKKPRNWPLDLHTRGQSPKAVALQNAYVAILFDQCNGLLKFGSDNNGNPNCGWEAVDLFS
jgi:hypothetical protein